MSATESTASEAKRVVSTQPVYDIVSTDTKLCYLLFQ